MKTIAFLLSAALAGTASYAFPAGMVAAAPKALAPAVSPAVSPAASPAVSPAVSLAGALAVAPVVAPVEADCSGCQASTYAHNFTGAPNCTSDVSITLMQQVSGTCNLQTCTPQTPCNFVTRSAFYGNCNTYYFENTFNGASGLFPPGSIHYDNISPACGTQASVIIETASAFRLAQLDLICSACTR